MANESYGSIIHNGVNYSLGSGANSANKTDISSIILTGTTNTSGSTITAGTWFYLNGEIVKAKVDIASNATFTENTNYEKKTIGAELAELNSNISSNYQKKNVSFGTITFSAENLLAAIRQALISDNIASSSYEFGSLQGDDGNFFIEGIWYRRGVFVWFIIFPFVNNFNQYDGYVLLVDSASNDFIKTVALS